MYRGIYREVYIEQYINLCVMTDTFVSVCIGVYRCLYHLYRCVQVSIPFMRNDGHICIGVYRCVQVCIGVYTSADQMYIFLCESSVQGLGFRVQGLGFSQGLEFTVHLGYTSAHQMQIFRVQCLGLRAQGLGLRVQGLGFHLGYTSAHQMQIFPCESPVAIFCPSWSTVRHVTCKRTHSIVREHILQ